MRLLIVEDNVKLGEYVRLGTENHGFTADIVGTGADADVAMSAAEYDIVILDLGLPDIDGTLWLKQLRDKRDLRPVLVLTARDAAEEVARNLNAGADDYLRKPFEMTELVARLRALLRRPGTHVAIDVVEGNLAMNLASRDVSVAGVRLELGRREIDGLEVLLRRFGRVVPKSALEESIYGFSEEVSSNAIEVLVHRLRKRLNDAGSTVTIHTLRGVGYMLAEGV